MVVRLLCAVGILMSSAYAAGREPDSAVGNQASAVCNEAPELKTHWGDEHLAAHRRTGFYLVTGHVGDQRQLMRVGISNSNTTYDGDEETNPFPDHETEESLFNTTLGQMKRTEYLGVRVDVQGLRPARVGVLARESALRPYIGVRSGVLGMDYLQHYCINCRPHEPWLEVSKTARPPEGVEPEPLHFLGNQPIQYVGLPGVAREKVIISTASNTFLSLRREVIAAMVSAGHAKPVYVSRMASDSGSTPTAAYVIRRMTFGGVNIADVVVTASHQSMIGLSLLDYFDWTIDLPNRQIWLKPLYEGDPLRPPVNASGMQAFPTFEGSIVVTVVRPDAAASEAGLKVGDHIVAIDGCSTSETSARELAELICENGRTLRLEVLREGGCVHSVPLQLKRTWEFPPKWEPEEVAAPLLPDFVSTNRRQGVHARDDRQAAGSS